MKPILGIALLLTWFCRCDEHGFYFPDPNGGDSHPGHHEDGGMAGGGPIGGAAAGSAAAGTGGVAADGGVDAGSVAADGGGKDGGIPDAAAADGGTAADGGSADGATDGGAPKPTECNGPPGLYVTGSCSSLASGIQTYQPKYELWSDGATKERFVYLPPNTQIDTTNPDRWAFPEGTRFYKTFSLDGLRIETRVIEKVAAATAVDSWTFTAYAWSQDQLSVAPADVAGVVNALGTSHDIPSQSQCKQCHTMPGLDAINGFGAIQLNHEAADISLAWLIDQGLLVNGTNPTLNVGTTNALIPGDTDTQTALGYLHANCGHCHGGPAPKANMTLWALVGAMTVANEPVSQSATCQCLTRWTARKNPMGDYYLERIAAGHADQSGVIGRMSVRGTSDQMPPLGTESVDATGLALVSAWINSLATNACDSAAICPQPGAAPAAGAGGSAASAGASGGAAPTSSSSTAGAAAPAPTTP